MNDTSCCWIKTKKIPNVQRRMSTSNARSFLFLTPIGQGRTGKVFQVCSTSGLMAAAAKAIHPQINQTISTVKKEKQKKKRAAEKALVRDIKSEPIVDDRFDEFWEFITTH